MRRSGVVLLVMVVVFGGVLGGFFAENAYSKGRATDSAEVKTPEPTSAGPLRKTGADAGDREKYEKGVEDQRQMLIKMVPMMAKRQLAGFEEMNNKFIEQLKGIRQVAETEGASETVKLIDKHIEQINAEYQQRYDEVEAGLYKRFGNSDKGFEKAKRWHKNIQNEIEREEQQKAKEADGEADSK